MAKMMGELLEDLMRRSERRERLKLVVRWARAIHALYPDDAVISACIEHVNAIAARPSPDARAAANEVLGVIGPDCELDMEEPLWKAQSGVWTALAMVAESMSASYESAAWVGVCLVVASREKAPAVDSELAYLWGPGVTPKAAEIAEGLSDEWDGTLNELFATAERLAS